MLANRLVTSQEQEAKQDIFFGQVVVIWARWAVLLASMVVAFWTSDTTVQLGRRFGLVSILVGGNFLLHGRYVTGTPLNRHSVLIVSGIDLLLVTAIVWLWPPGSGLDSPFFVLYYPLVFAVALVFVPRIGLAFAAAALGAYASVCAATGTLATTMEMRSFFMRSVTLLAMGVLGASYWRMQRERHRAGVLAGANVSAGPDRDRALAKTTLGA